MVQEAPHSALVNKGRLLGRGDAHAGPKGKPPLLTGSLHKLMEKMKEPLSLETLWKGTSRSLEDHRPSRPLPLLFASVTTSPLDTHLDRPQ